MLARRIKASQLFPAHDKLIEKGIVNLTYEMKRAQKSALEEVSTTTR